MTTVGFIGAGNMGYAIMKGIKGSEKSSEVSLYAFDIYQEACVRAEQLGAKITADAAELVGSGSYVFLSVQPQQRP